jgi:hypothetical protein
MKILIKALTILSISFASISAHAEFVSVDDWHYTSDDLNGLKQSVSVPDVYYALTKFVTFDATATFEQLDGFHFATRAEHASLLGSLLGTTGNMDYVRPYRSIGGWSNYPSTPGALSTQYKIIYSDSSTFGGWVHAGSYETNVQSSVVANGDINVAGFVLIKDPVAAPVSSPASIGVFSLVLLGLGLRRKQK